MASTTSSLLLPLPKSLQPVRNSLSVTPRHANARPISASRREFLVLTATTSLTAVILPSSAQAKSIPLFGIRKKIEKAEEQAEEFVKEGFESAEKGLETAEKGVAEVEKEIETAAEEGAFNGLAQAGAVAAAEVFGVVVATSIVSGILGPEPKSS